MRTPSFRQRRKRLDDFAANANTVGSIDVFETVNGRISSSADSDWFRIQLDARTDYIISVDGNSQLDTVLRLRDSAGRELISNDDRDTSTTDSEIVFRPDTPGTYYLDVQGFQGSRGIYSLGLEALKPLNPAGPSLNFNIDLQYSGDQRFKPFFDRAALRWAQIITGDLPDFEGIDDLQINISAVPIDGEGGTLGRAGFDALRPIELGGLPYLGSVELDSGDLQILLNEGSLLDVVTHEIGHVLGIGTLWSSRQLLSGSRYTGSNGVREYQRSGGVEMSVPLETTGGQTTDLVHWSESAFGNELMTGFFAQGANPLSSITIGSLEDLGYLVDYTVADPYSLPLASRALSIPGSLLRSIPSSQGTQTSAVSSLSDPLTNFSKLCRCGTCLSLQKTIISSSSPSDLSSRVSSQDKPLSQLSVRDITANLIMPDIETQASFKTLTTESPQDSRSSLTEKRFLNPDGLLVPDSWA